VAVRWGILSTALINRKFLAGARTAAGVEVIAVASRDGETAIRYAQEHGIERAYAGYDALLADEDVEAVYISLPNSLHVEWTVRALEAGKHVLCEKPLGRHADEVAHAFDVAERNDRLLMEAFMYRHNPQTQRVVSLVAEGAIGRLRLIRGAFGFLTTDSANVRLSSTLAGGALMDVGCYCVSAARLLAGEPSSVTAQQVVGGDGVDVLFSGTLSFPGDVLAHFDAGLTVASRDELEVVGESGSLFLDDPWHCRVPVIELRSDRGVERIVLEPVDSYGLEAANLAAAIRGVEEPALGRDDAIGQARAIEALYLAAESGRSVVLT
jgi:predicted dehydrogenase